MVIDILCTNVVPVSEAWHSQLSQDRQWLSINILEVTFVVCHFVGINCKKKDKHLGIPNSGDTTAEINIFYQNWITIKIEIIFRSKISLLLKHESMKKWSATHPIIQQLIWHIIWIKSDDVATPHSEIRQLINVYKYQSQPFIKTTRKPSCRWQTRTTRKPAKIAPIRRAYNVVADNTGLSSCV